MNSVTVPGSQQTHTLLATPYGEKALYFEIQKNRSADSRSSHEIAIELQRQLWQLNDRLIASRSYAVEDIILGNHNLTVTFRPLEITPERVLSWVTDNWKKTDTRGYFQQNEDRILEADFSHQSGPDLGQLAAAAGMTIPDAIDLLCARSYPVLFLGFQPGFTYLAGLEKRLQYPRHIQPRTRVAAGSIGIAGEQLGIYPNESPGGWQIVGKINSNCLPLIDFQGDSPIGIKVGDSIRFRSVDGLSC